LAEPECDFDVFIDDRNVVEMKNELLADAPWAHHGVFE
jgi:hypothetical protein